MSMFDFVHNNKRIVQFLLVMIALSFIIVGTDSIFNLFGQKPAVTYDGGEISREELAKFVSEQKAQLRSNPQSAQLDPAMFETAEFQELILQQYLDNQLNTEELKKLRLYLSDQYLKNFIGSIEAFHENGQFSVEKYKQELNRAGLTPEAFEARYRSELSRGIIFASIAGSSVVSETITSKLLNYTLQERHVDSTLFKTENYLSKVTVSDKDVKAYYEKNKKQFELPEQVKVAYLILTADDIQKNITISEKDIEAWYQKNKADFAVPERRDMRHILIVVDPADPNSDKAAKQKIEGLLAKVKAQPTQFSALANQFSDDRATAENGGKMEEVTLVMLDPTFGQALFALKAPGDISPVVKSQYGYHIIALDKIHPERVLPLAEVHDEVQKALLESQMAKEMEQRRTEFTDLVYSQPSLDEAAKVFGLTVNKTDWLTKETIKEIPVLAHPQLTSELFDTVRTKESRNTDVVELPGGNAVAARVLEHKPTALVSFDSAKADIKKRLINQKAEELAKKDGLALIQALRKNPAHPVAWKPEGMVSLWDPQQLTDVAQRAVMRADVSGIATAPAFTGTLIGSGFAVYRINKVTQRPLSSDQERLAGMNMLQQKLMEDARRAFINAYLATIRARGDIVVNKEQIDKSRQLSN